MEKTCFACKETRDISQFSPNNQKKDGFHPYCKACQSAKIKAGRRARISTGGISRRQDGEKRCNQCEQTLSVEAFGSNRANHDGLQTYCRECCVATVTASRKKHPQRHRDRNKKWKTEHPEQAHDMHLRRTYGVKYGTYAEMLAKQNGKCAICETDAPGGNSRFFHLDHCHDTQQIRGLLCTSCNNGIGRFGHDPERIRKAVAYMVEHSLEGG